MKVEFHAALHVSFRLGGRAARTQPGCGVLFFVISTSNQGFFGPLRKPRDKI
jgi:hypothetical protein